MATELEPTKPATPAPISYIPPEARLPELTWRAVILGAMLGVIFGASSLYLVLKVGLTVSASIPVAVISLTLFRLWAKMGGRDASILENNIVQTAGSAGESIAFGLGVTMPAIMILGFDLEIGRVMLVGLLGSLLGILMMIPLRRALIIAQHEQLKYPEGTACAEVLKAGASEESKAAAAKTAIPFPMNPGHEDPSPSTPLPSEGRGEPARSASMGSMREVDRGNLTPTPLPEEGGGALAAAAERARDKDRGRGGERERGGEGADSFGPTPLTPPVSDSGTASEGRELRGRGTGGGRGRNDDASGHEIGVGPVRELRAGTIFTGFGIGLVYKSLMDAFKLWKDTPEKVFGPPLSGGSIASEISPELLGVGYIIGPKIGSIMMAGGVLSALVLAPLIKFFGGLLATPLAPGSKPISEMSPGEIRGAYILYIGAGAVAAGGIVSLLRSLPIIWHGLRSGVADFRAAATVQASALRTERDLSMKLVAGGIVALIIAILAAPSLHMNIGGALLIVLFGFLFVTVSSRLTGEIGSSSNPISGMTVATLLLTCLIFLLVGWTGPVFYVTALSVGGIVCVAASNGGSTSQDLKTGFLVGATPKYQQIAIMVGAAASALLLGPILLALNDTGTVYVPAGQVAPGLHAPASAELGAAELIRGPQAEASHVTYRVWQKTNTVDGPAGRYLVDDAGKAVWLVDPGINGAYKTRPDGTQVQKYDAPKATLMSYIIKGMLDRRLPWGVVLFGVMIAVVLELCGVSSLAFAVGVYLPISSSAPIFVGGLIRWLVDYFRRRELRHHHLDEAQLAAEGDKSPGVLLASGYIAGGAIAGIVIAFVAGAMPRTDARLTRWAEAANPFFAGPNADWLSLIPFVALVLFLYFVGREFVLAGRKKG